MENYDRRGKFSSSVFYLILSSRVHRVEKLATPSRFFPPSSLPSYRLTIFPRQVSMGRVTFRPLTEAPRGWGLMRTTDFAGKLVVFFFSRFFLSSLRSSPCACFYNTRRVFTGLFSQILYSLCDPTAIISKFFSRGRGWKQRKLQR